MQNWEYIALLLNGDEVIRIKHELLQQSRPLQGCLDDLGKDGWDIAGMAGATSPTPSIVLILKRPL